MARLDDAARQEFLAAHADWTLDGETISKTFVLRDFVDAMAFVTKVAFAAEIADHHPDIHVSWNKVTLELSTHSEGALTARDTDLAARCDAF